MKELEGKTVYLRPTGNNARRGAADVQKAFIAKVAKVNVTFILNGMSREFKYRFKGRQLSSELNSGYVVYESAKELSDYYEAQELAAAISEKYRYQSDYAQLRLDKLKQVAEILEV